MPKITFTDKVDSRLVNVPAVNKIISSDVNQLKDGVNANEIDIATNATNISTNDTDIDTNATDIATNVTDIATNVTALGQTVRITGDQSIAGIKTFTDSVIATTQANATDNTTVATTAYVKNLIGEIPAGLSFEGTWNADTDTPDLSALTANNGQFWIVSVNGATDLSGITDWKVGDWAIYVVDGAGANGWQKVDNSSVLDGQGTGQKVALWSGSGDSNTLTNAPITVSGNDVDVTGSVSATDGLFSGDVSITNSSGDPFLKLETSAQEYVFRIDQSDSEKLQLRNTTNNTTLLSFDSTSNSSTFASSVTAGGAFYVNNQVKNLNSSTAITLHNNGTTYFSGGGNFSSSLSVNGNSTINGGSGGDVLNLDKSTGASLALSGSTGTTNKVLFVGTNSTNPDLNIYVGGAIRQTISSSGAATFSSSVSATELNIEADSGSSFINISTPSNANSSGLKLRQSSNFGFDLYANDDETLDLGRGLYINPIENGVSSNAMFIDRGTKAATFASSVSATILKASSSGSTYSIDPHAGGVDLHSTGNIAPHYQTNYTIYNGNIGAGSQVFRLDSSGAATFASSVTATDATFSGDVKIGASGVPDRTLHVESSSVAAIQLENTSEADAFIDFTNPSKTFRVGYDDSDDAFKIAISNFNSNAFVVNSSGNILIGTGTDNSSKLQVNGSATFESSVSAGDNIYLNNSKYLSGRNVADSADVLLIGLDANDKVKIDPLGYGTNIFNDLEVGDDLTVNGETFFGTTGTPNGTTNYGSAFITGSSDRRYLNFATSSTTTREHIQFFNPNSRVGSITTNGFATSYNTNSDYRLKEDLKDFNGLEMVSNIPVYDYKWKADESRSFGVMAHELQEVLPNAVSGEKDAEEMQGVDYSKIVPLLIKSIQELKEEIELLKNK